jgi:hypothetical protein
VPPAVSVDGCLFLTSLGGGVLFRVAVLPARLVALSPFRTLEAAARLSILLRREPGEMEEAGDWLLMVP